MLSGLKSKIKFTKSIFFYYSAILVGICILAIIVYSAYLPLNQTLKIGEKAPKNIFVNQKIQIQTSQDRIKTAALIEKVRNESKPIYTIDQQINLAIETDIKAFFQTIKQKNYINKEGASVEYLLDLDIKELKSIEYYTLQAIRQILQLGLTNINPNEIKEQVASYLAILDLNIQKIDAIQFVVLKFIQPNLSFDKLKTAQALQVKVNDIQPVVTIINKGQSIIKKGTIVESHHIELLKEASLDQNQFSWIRFIGILGFMCLLSVILEVFIFYLKPLIYKQKKYILLTFLMMITLAVFARLIQEISLLTPFLSMKFFIPIPFLAMTLLLLIGPHVAILSGTILSIAISIMYFRDFSLFVYLFLSTSITTFLCYQRYKRSDLVVSAYKVGVIQMILVLLIGFIEGSLSILWYASNMALAFANGVLSSMICLAVLPYLESGFKIITSQTLLELTNLNHPILKRLMVTALGTYQHSLMVANLAENAANAIQADGLLVRVGAYFHDIGKIKRRLFFTENQFSEENPHDTLAPKISKIIIANHVKDGLELAERYKLPSIIHEFIKEHHGTSLISFFYNKEKQLNNDDESIINEDDFRYVGPKPHFKESGVLMLADSVEAAVRSLDKPTPAKIANLIDVVFQEKIEDEQLSECPLSLGEIQIIKNSFNEFFKGIYHTRVNYKKELDSLAESQNNKSE